MKPETKTSVPTVIVSKVVFVMAAFLFSFCVGCVSSSEAVRDQVPEEGTVAQLETYGAIDSIDTPNSHKEEFENKIMDKRFEREMEQSPFADTKSSGEILALQQANEERSLERQKLEASENTKKRKLTKTSFKTKKTALGVKKNKVANSSKDSKITRKNYVVVPGKKYKVAKKISREK